MRAIQAGDPGARLLLWTQRALFAAGFLLLSYCVVVLADSWTFQKRAQVELKLASTRPRPAAVRPGDLIGSVNVDRLGLSVAFTEGTEEESLRHAAGHIEGTVFPGEVGNTGIAAHRDTFFRPLRNIRIDDVVRVTTAQGEYRYRVVSTRVVQPEDVAVLASDDREVLTLVTCYPFYFIGAAPSRFVVRAERIVGGPVAELEGGAAGE